MVCVIYHCNSQSLTIIITLYNIKGMLHLSRKIYANLKIKFIAEEGEHHQPYDYCIL